jgi:CRISPR/Cas system-associated exonuclease Cas4 (RecB family)
MSSPLCPLLYPLLYPGAYFLLIEEKYGERPAFGVVVLGDGSRVEVENTDALRSEVLSIAEQIRERRRAIGEEIPVRQPACKCRVCGQRGNCWQARTPSASSGRKF